MAIMTFRIYYNTYVYYYIHDCILNYYHTYDIEVLLLSIMTIAKHYVHYVYYHNCHNSYNSHNSNKIILLKSTHKSGILGWFNRRKAFVHTRARYSSKNIVKARWCVYLPSGLHPSETGVKHRL